MPNVKRRVSPCAQVGETMNEDLFRVYLVIVAIVAILALVVPSPVQVERAKLDRLSGQAPATFVGWLTASAPLTLQSGSALPGRACTGSLRSS